MLGLDLRGKNRESGITYETFGFEIVSRLIFRNVRSKIIHRYWLNIVHKIKYFKSKLHYHLQY